MHVSQHHLKQQPQVILLEVKVLLGPARWKASDTEHTPQDARTASATKDSQVHDGNSAKAKNMNIKD